MRCCCRCTSLTSLSLGMLTPRELDTMFTVGGLPDAITVLQNLQHLRLQNCAMGRLTRSISRLTRLTTLEVVHDDTYNFSECYTYDLPVRQVGGYNNTMHPLLAVLLWTPPWPWCAWR